MPNDGKKTINAKQALTDIRSGMSDTELMEKYGLSDKGLQILLKKLVDVGHLKEHELQARSSATSAGVRIAWKCPACGTPQTRAYDECPNCGVIVVKFQQRQEDLYDHRDHVVGSSLSRANSSRIRGCWRRCHRCPKV